MRAPARLRAFALLAVGAVLAAGCTGGAGGGDKAGGGGQPVVLKMAGGPSADPGTAYFVRRVGELSGGTLRIENIAGWGGTDPTVEQNIVRDVAAEKADLGSVGTRVFDTLGIDGFQALTAPMLIDNYPLEQAVIASDIPARMLQGLATVKVTGLAVLGDGLRKPIAVQRPLLRPADWHGITFAAFRSKIQAEAVEALGARSTDLWSTALSGALASGEVQGLENNLLVYQAAGRAHSAPYVAANVNLWPHTVALVANPDRLSRLTGQQREWIREAAADAAARSTSLVEHEDQVVMDLCQAGARFANASQADLMALRQAFLPVYAMLERDPQTKSFMAGIEELKASTPAGAPLVIPAECTGSALQGHTTDDLIAGTWTTGKITENEWVRAFIGGGGTEKEAHFSFDARGTKYWSLRFEGGNFTLIQQDGSIGYGPDPYQIGGDGILTIRDAQCVGTYRPAVTANTLRLHVVKQCTGLDRPYATTLFASFPLTRSS